MTEVAASAPVPPGWYPDPLHGSGRRWWSGSEWTEQTWHDDVVIPERPRMVAGSASAAVAAAYGDGRRADPYRLRNPLPMIAFCVAVAGAIVILLAFVVPMPLLLLLLASGGTGGFGTLALVSSIKLGTGLRLSVAAVIIGGANILLSLIGGVGGLGL